MIHQIILDTVLNDKTVSSAGIVQLDNASVVASTPSFHLAKKDCFLVEQLFLHAEDDVTYLNIGDTNYNISRLDPFSLYAKNEGKGVVISKTAKYVVFGFYDDSSSPIVAVEAIEILGEYLRKKGQ
eukprot:GCRY01003372.1.p1 GENE.GCRY01003372.1~~GCRY01003372.1.p1  ORF type:complete len:126 (+),score=11.97 GCRY01003372.1:283-660(+)